jgi:ribosomal protein S18 acetylase RimI-like enzyme
MKVEPLRDDQVELVDAYLPLSRLDSWHQGRASRRSDYLIAWEGEEPVGHAHVAWPEEANELPEVQDVFVPEAKRRRGIARALTAAAEREAAARGFDRLALTVGLDNAPARRLYEAMGYEYTDREPERVKGTIMIRGAPLEVDDTLLFLEKPLS